MFVLRVLSELSLVLLVQESEGTEEDEETEVKKERREEGGRAAEGRDVGSSCDQISALITKSLLPRLVGLFLSIKISGFLLYVLFLSEQKQVIFFFSSIFYVCASCNVIDYVSCYQNISFNIP